jgi:DhnA family fructose-bisphosphate aldolase class Ia
MKSPGKAIRLGRIFQEDHRTVILPLDHGLEAGPIAGFEVAERTLRTVIEGGADAILTSYGVANRYPELFGHVGLILRVDGGTTSRSMDWQGVDQLLTVEDALRLGADAVVINGFLGGPHETESLTRVGRMAGACAAWQMPLVVEMFMSSDVKPTVENVAMAARIGAELGADLVKTYYAGDPRSYKAVTEHSFAPIVILGGEKIDNEWAALQWARQAMDAGAAGTCIGRNVWQHHNAKGMVQALRAIVHENASLDEAVKIVEGSSS